MRVSCLPADLLVSWKWVGLALVWTVVGEWKEELLGLLEELLSCKFEFPISKQLIEMLTDPLFLAMCDATKRADTKRMKFPATCQAKRMETHSNVSGYVWASPSPDPYKDERVNLAFLVLSHRFLTDWERQKDRRALKNLEQNISLLCERELYLGKVGFSFSHLWSQLLILDAKPSSFNLAPNCTNKRPIRSMIFHLSNLKSLFILCHPSFSVELSRADDGRLTAKIWIC